MGVAHQTFVRSHSPSCAITVPLHQPGWRLRLVVKADKRPVAFRAARVREELAEVHGWFPAVRPELSKPDGRWLAKESCSAPT